MSICLSQEAGDGGEEKACFKQPHHPAHNLLCLAMGKGASPNFQPSPSALCCLPSLVRRILSRSTGLQKSLLPALWRSCHWPLLSTAKLQLVWGCVAWKGAGETEEAGEGGAGSQGGLPGKETLAALAPAAAKLPGKQGRLRGDEEAQDSHSAIRGP